MLLNFQFSFGTCASNDLNDAGKSENAQVVKRKSTAIEVYRAVKPGAGFKSVKTV